MTPDTTSRGATPTQAAPSPTPTAPAAGPPTAGHPAPAAGGPPAGFDLRTFAPGWGASVMGTSALAVALLAVGEGTSAAGATEVAARTVLVLALLLGAVVLTLTAARWVRFRRDALADLRHPVKGGMTSTAAGALLTLAVAIGKVGPGFLPEAVILPAVTILAVAGGLLALLIGWEFLAEIFTSRDAALAQMSGAWFVPPVVTIIVPLALLPLITEHPGAAPDLLAISWAFLGMGAVLYLVVTATLFMRSISHPLPPAGLAPTLFIGMGPAGLLALDLVRLTQVSIDSGAAPESLLATVLPAASMMWGFALWWMVSALIVLTRGYAQLPFALSWWGFTFPLAAWTIATIVLARAWDSGILSVIAWAATAALAALWAYVAGRTLAGIRTGSIWAH
jgi:C4-dicarboxylate transporter/malic acid transport protein